MALEIEDGTGKANSDSYVSVAELTSYAALRSVTLPATDAEKELLLRKAMDFLETQAFTGTRKTREQALSWPRYGVVIDGFDIPDTEIPRELKESQMQAAMDSLTVDLLPTTAAGAKGAVLEESVEGAVSVKYAEPASVGPGVGPAGATLSRLGALLAPLLANGGGFARARVGRG